MLIGQPRTKQKQFKNLKILNGFLYREQKINKDGSKLFYCACKYITFQSIF